MTVFSLVNAVRLDLINLGNLSASLEIYQEIGERIVVWSLRYSLTCFDSVR